MRKLIEVAHNSWIMLNSDDCCMMNNTRFCYNPVSVAGYKKSIENIPSFYCAEHALLSGDKIKMPIEKWDNLKILMENI